MDKMEKTMRNYKTYLITAVTIASCAAMVACGELDASKKKSATTPTTNQQTGTQQVTGPQTKLQIIGKDLDGTLDRLRLTVVRPDKTEIVFSGLINIDSTLSNSVDGTALKPEAGGTFDALIYKSVMPSGDISYVFTYYVNYDESKPYVLIFAGKIGSNDIRLVKDETYLPSLNLETEASLSTINVRDLLVDWLKQQGINGLDSFKAYALANGNGGSSGTGGFEF